MQPNVILLEALRKIHEDPYPDIGICYQVDEYVRFKSGGIAGAVQELMYKLFAKWPKYSGLRDFPIPDVTYHPSDAYQVKSKQYWDRSTEYGALRWELLEFCIVQLENLNGD